MNDDCLKLTAYLGERDRIGDLSVADALLDAYGQAKLEASVLLRGAEGFGLSHHLRSDRLLSLSEDLPLVSLAVDHRERIEAVLPTVREIKRRGLLTLEQAQMLTDGIEGISLPPDPHTATRMTVYVGRQEKVFGQPAFMAICDLLHRRGLAGATVLLGVDGTVRGERKRGRFFSRNAEVPMMVVALGSGDRIAAVLPELTGLLRGPLVTLEQVQICKRDGALLERPAPQPGKTEPGTDAWQKLVIYSSEASRHGRHPIHSTLMHRLRESMPAGGATSLRGVWGFHGDHAPHGDRLFQLRRHVPVVTTIIDTPERIAPAFAIVDELTAERGLVTSETVPVLIGVDETEKRSAA